MSQRARDKAKNQTEGLRVLLVDDHDLFRTGLRNLLEEQGVQIVGEAANGQDAIRCVREFAPDVVVMDLNMPGMSGVDATREITSFAPLTRVVVLTISDHLGWDDGEHLLQLQDKLNAYLRFIESGELLEKYPDAKSRRAQITVVCKHTPDARGEEFLSRASALTADVGIVLTYEVLSDPSEGASK